ncbi:hypothetical protein ACIBI9_21275 [Nonomuraea sp. NPDC050451]|uniref:hypothetical protein n=1 Tax=Nonomuraea sp. NPDC050451 TaxID=3364364 RepID=UPI0037ABB719
MAVTGYPGKDAFIADPGSPLQGRTKLLSCTVATCRFGSAGQGLCSEHRDRWQRAGRLIATTYELARRNLAGRREGLVRQRAVVRRRHDPAATPNLLVGAGHVGRAEGSPVRRSPAGVPGKGRVTHSPETFLGGYSA